MPHMIGLCIGWCIFAGLMLFLSSMNSTVAVASISLVGLFGVILAVWAVQREMAHVQNLEIALKRAEGQVVQLGTIMSYTNTAMASTDITGKIVWVNETFTELTGYSLLEVEALNILDVIIGPESDAKVVEQIRQCIKRQRSCQVDLLTYIRGSDKHWVNVELKPLHDRSGNISNFLVVQQEISKRKAREQQLARQAMHDVLTGLPNRQTFGLRLNVAMDEYHRSGQEFAVLFMDLDGFKPVNDTYGHDAGDKVLVIVAERLKQCIRSHDTVARLGGDEFTVLLTNIRGPQDAQHAADRFLKAVSQPIDIGEAVVKISTSIGVAICGPEFIKADDILDASDQAMYTAKKSGKAKACILPTRQVAQPPQENQ
ncbi:MAG: diguanylate cyclase [Planctomycetes bacterium]|nr:diguanylate cyclase [Planctomycetota bacterium]